MYLNDNVFILKTINTMNTCHISLTNTNKVVLCSKEDFDILSRKKWYLCGNYIKMTDDDIRMHRYVYIQLMGNTIPNGMVVDHINRNTLDNRRENLRSIYASQNTQNKSKKNGSSSKYYGVSLLKTQKYRARIRFDNKVISLGNYITEIEAAKAYDLFLTHHPQRGTEMQLCHPMNFPENLDMYLKMEPLILKSKKSKMKNHGQISTYNKENKDSLNKENKGSLNKDEEFVLTQGEKLDESTIRVILTNMPEKIALIDKEDYEKLKKYKFTGSVNGISVNINGVTRLIHRVIMNVNDSSVYIDHINNDRFDNRKTNLRCSNAKLNSQNKKKQQNLSSKFLGVSKKKITSKGIYWQSHVRNGKTRFVTCDYNEEYVARKRDLYIIKNMPNSHMKFNFIWTKEEIENWSNKLHI